VRVGGGSTIIASTRVIDESFVIERASGAPEDRRVLSRVSFGRRDRARPVRASPRRATITTAGRCLFL